MLADNIFEHTIRSHVELYRNQEKGARVLLKTVDNPERFGIAELNGNRIISIEEKSKHPKSNYAVVGAYFHDSNVFDIMRHISPSGRGEYEITSVSNEYIRRRQLEYGMVRGSWIDAGTFDALIEARKIFGKRVITAARGARYSKTIRDLRTSSVIRELAIEFWSKFEFILWFMRYPSLRPGRQRNEGSRSY